MYRIAKRSLQTRLIGLARLEYPPRPPVEFHVGISGLERFDLAGVGMRPVEIRRIRRAASAAHENGDDEDDA